MGMLVAVTRCKGEEAPLLLLVAPTAPLNEPGGQNEQLASADALVGELAYTPGAQREQMVAPASDAV